MVRTYRPLLFYVLLMLLPRLTRGQEGVHTSMFDAQWIRAVVSIDVANPKAPQTYIHAGAGFLVQSPRGHLLLVTAKHVYKALADAKLDAVYSVPLGTGSVTVKEGELKNNGAGDWFLSGSADVVCRFIGFPGENSPAAIPLSAFLPRNELEPGAPLLVLGFPYGEPKPGATRAIVRHGVFAGTDDAGHLIADAFVFPGNSGGPVVYVPTVKIGAPLRSPLVNEEKLVGLVQSMTVLSAPVQAYVETTVFVNSGLSGLVPASDIQDLILGKDVARVDSALPRK